MKIKHKLQECIPKAYYSDGTEAKCWMYKICDMFDVNSYSFKRVKEKKSMGNSSKESDYRFIDRFSVEKEKKELDMN